MTTSEVLSVYISKLKHPIREIRERSLYLLLAKLKYGWELDDELSGTRQLLEALLNWFQAPQPTLQKEALELFLTIMKTKSGTYICNEIGMTHILASLKVIKPSLNNTAALDIYNDIIETLKFLKTVESEENVCVPRLNLPSVTSSETDNDLHHGDDNVHSLQSSNENSVVTPRTKKKYEESVNHEEIHLLLLPWVELNAADLKTMLLIEDSLKIIKSVRRCCRFIRDVFLRDFPAEIFLNRPTIIKNLVAIIEGVHGNQLEEVLQVLLSITNALYTRKLELTSLHLIHKHNKLTEDLTSNDDTNVDIEILSHHAEIKLEKQQDGLVALRQLPAPLYALETMQSILSALARSITSVDSITKTEILNIKETNISLDLLDSLIRLFLACVSANFWMLDHRTKTHRDIAHKSCMVMRLLGDLLMKYRKAFFEDNDNVHHRAVWLRLVICAQTLLHWARESALPPSCLVTSLQMAQLDPALQILYPDLSEKVTLALQITKTSVDQEYKMKYRELMKLTSSMDDAVRFMKNKNSCRNSKDILWCIKKSLPVIELHMSELYLNEVADILLCKIKDFKLDDTDWDVARSIALNLLAHNVEWVQAKFYTKMLEMVKLVLVGEESDQAKNEKSLMLLFDVGILTEICCHGLSSKTKQVETCASEIMLYFLRGRMVLTESCWWRLLASLLPVLPLLHVYAAHETQLGQAICKSLEMEIASCMGVSLAATTWGLSRLLFSRCVRVQLDSARALCRLLDDEKYLPPKEALRPDVLMSALRRLQPQNFNVDLNSSPSKNPQMTGLLQMLDVLKQDIVLDEHGVEYVTRDSVKPILEPSLRRSTLQQLAVLARQQDTHSVLLQNDGLKLVVAILRMSMMVDDYLAFPECALSCVSILNSISFMSRHSLAQIADLPTLLIRVILVFPANDSVVLMAAQVLALSAWSGFVLQELDADRHRVPALPACVRQRTCLPFSANTYWNTSPNAEHSSIEWLTRDEEWRCALRVRWWCAYEGRTRVCRGAPISPPPAPLPLQPSPSDRATLRASCPSQTLAAGLLALENATAHSQVVEALNLLECYVKLASCSITKSEEIVALPWQHTQRFLRAPPASSRDTALLIALVRFVLVYLDRLPSGGDISWIKSSFIGNDATIISLLSKDQLLPQQGAQDSIEVTQLHIHIVKVVTRCVKRLEFEDYDTNKLESLLKILLSCLERIDLKNFHVLGYLNELMRCIRYVLHSRYCKLSQDTLIQTLNIVTRTLSGCASGGGRKGQACRLDAILCLLALLRQVQEESIPIQRWSEIWHGDVTVAVFGCSRGACPQLRAAALHCIAALAHYPQLLPQLQQANREESLAGFALQIFADIDEANIVRSVAADLITAITSRLSPHSDLLETEILSQLKNYDIIEHSLEILVNFCNEKTHTNSIEPNIPLSMLESRSELEVRAQKCQDVVVSPSRWVGCQAPPTPQLVASTADMLHNVTAFAKCPIQEWNERGLYRLLFRCASWDDESQRVRSAASRALVAACSNKCVRASLAATKDCLHTLLATLIPIQEDELNKDTIDALAQGLLLLASLLPERAAALTVASALYERQITTLFCCILQALEIGDKGLQSAALQCLTQIVQCIPKKCPEQSIDETWYKFFDNLKMADRGSARRGAGDTKDDCRPDFMAEELCKVLLMLHQDMSLEDKNYQSSQEFSDDSWVRLSACISSVLASSPRGRAYATHRGLPARLLADLRGLRDRLSVLGKPIETIKNANHSPILRTLYWLMNLINCSLIECLEAKESYAEDDIAVSLNPLWPWCMMTEQLRVSVVTLLFNFTNDCPKAWSAMSMCVGGQNLCNSMCTLTIREAGQVGKAASTLLACSGILVHVTPHQQCRAIIIKSEVLSSLYKAMMRERVRGAWGAAARACERVSCAAAVRADGAAAVLALRPAGPAAPRLLPAVAHAAHHHRATVLHAPELLELLCGSLLAGDTAEVISAARAVWSLAANNHKGKLLLRSAGVTAAVQSALQRIQRCTQTTQANERALQLLTYTNTVLHTT